MTTESSNICQQDIPQQRSLMSKQPEVLKQTELLNRLVLDRHTAEEVGRVVSLLLDPPAHRVMGLTCKSGFLGSKKRFFTWGQIETIGIDSIMLEVSPEEALTEKQESWDVLIGHEVWTDAGNKVGKLTDYLMNSETGNVINYLFSSNGWRGMVDGLYLLPPTAISSIGSKRIITLEALIQNSECYSEGLNQKFGQVAELLKEDYEKTLKHVETVRNLQQNVAEQVKDRTKVVTDTVKEKVSEVKTQLQDNSQPGIPEHKETESNLDSESNTSSPKS
ncbi:MAG: photosystem reaction center subunit H [Symploca sp. SIO1C2]|nr:photosystem reaction center subunit H [Symploca sp. SIO1C2]